MTTTALLDADVIAYKAAVVGSSNFVNLDGGEDSHVPHEGRITEAVDNLISGWVRQAGADTYYACLTSAGNFRKELSPAYKAHRTAPPPGLKIARKYIEKNYPTMLINRLEADDVMGIHATSGRFKDAVIVSIDKDLMSVPARVLNPGKPGGPRLISKAEANRAWLTQTLTGDTSDGYSGAKGIGPKKAEALLRDCRSLAEAWDVVVRAFVKSGQSEMDALLNARLARILRAEDWDGNKGAVKLWDTMNSRQLIFVNASRP